MFTASRLGFRLSDRLFSIVQRVLPFGACAAIRHLVRYAAIILTCSLTSHLAAADVNEEHTAQEWMEVARQETIQQKDWESTHPIDAAIVLGAGQFVTSMYCRNPDANFVVGTKEFNDWWKAIGTQTMEKWAADGFPLIMDRDHVMLSIMALYSATGTPRTNPVIYINGASFANPNHFWNYFDRMKAAGIAAETKGCMGQTLNRTDFGVLRLFAAMSYSMWAVPYLPYAYQLTVTYDPAPGMIAPDFTLPRLETLLKAKDYTDAYSFEYERPFHSDMANFLLNVCCGYTAVPAADRKPGGSLVKALPYPASNPGNATLSASRGKKPVLLIFTAPSDNWCSMSLPTLEPLYEATKDQIDWYLICDDLNDNQIWNTYFFPPSKSNHVLMQKEMSNLERAQMGKMLEMREVNLAFPFLADDLTQRVENAYEDGGGLAKIILIDRNGVITMNDWLNPQPKGYVNIGVGIGIYGFQDMAQVQSVVSANVKALLNNHGLWNGKDAVIPDWHPLDKLVNVTIKAIDPVSGLVTVAGADQKPVEVKVDESSRIVAAPATKVFKKLSDLSVGSVVSITYVPNADPPGKLAALVLSGASINDFISNACWGIPDMLWCPAVVVAKTDSSLSVTVIPHTIAELPGLDYLLKAGDQVKPVSWKVANVQDWVDHPNQVLTVHVDRATYVILNGMMASASDIHVGDHLGIEFRPEQSAADRRPFFIYDYRYGDASPGDSQEKSK